MQLIDMVTGRGYMDINRISGYIPGKIVFFLMQVGRTCKFEGHHVHVTVTDNDPKCLEA